MNRRLLAPLVAVFLSSCVKVETRDPKYVEHNALSDPRLASMVQTAKAGALQVDSVVYKPKLYPLSGILERLARGEFKKALTRTRLRYNKANFDDEALMTLIKQGFIPVPVTVTNTGQKKVDARGLKLSLEDDDFSLAPIVESRLPDEFQSLNPKALAANTYNVTMVVGAAAVVMAAIYFDANGHGNGGGNLDFPANDNEIFNPVTKTTTIDYNGLLFKGSVLAPGESARGLLFFKAKGVDWSALNLQASLP